jgi:glycosyltransferase involved in cell wall biosynthesis
VKKLYLISYYFAPLGRADGINRTYLVKYLADLGWDIEVISCKNPHAFIRNFQKDFSLMELIPPQVKLHQIKSFYWGPIGGIAALFGLVDEPFWNWYFPVLRAAKSIFKETGYIYSIAPPAINVRLAWEIAKEKKMPMIIDFRDDTFNLPYSVVKNARTIIASTEISLKNMQNHYNLDNNFGIAIYNGYPINDAMDKSSKRNKIGKLNIVYAGLLNLDQDPVLLAKAIKYMEQKYPHTKNVVSVDYYGPKNYYTRLLLRKYLNDNIRFGGYIPFQTVLSEIAQADLTYVSLKDIRKAYCIPSKVFQYISMETPILATGPDGALKEFITQNKIGRFSLSNDIESQADDILYFLKNNQAYAEAVKNIQKIKSRLSMQSQVQRLDDHLIQLEKNRTVCASIKHTKN